MLNRIISSIVFSVIAIALVGCAGMNAKQEQIDTVVRSQVDVLKKIVSIREQEPLKSKILSDPILANQERILMSGLKSVISSQEIFLKTRNESTKK